MVWSGWGAEWAQGRFTWCWGWVVTQGRGLHLSRGLWMSGGPFPLSGACRNVPVVDTSHVCNLFPSWRQVGVCLEWLLAPNIWWKKIVNGWMDGGCRAIILLLRFPQNFPSLWLFLHHTVNSKWTHIELRQQLSWITGICCTCPF